MTTEGKIRYTFSHPCKYMHAIQDINTQVTSCADYGRPVLTQQQANIIKEKILDNFFASDLTDASGMNLARAAVDSFVKE